ncbi:MULTISPECIES: FtsX-like permease family protein [Streptacidiphilus]|uniref:FtsX-like permease family protein n=1 Tax=Streptacidiphilus cavernicola TaxID=3342716 RepID=A0ABV6UI45_9ACTN|nr:FtsX-like permease family protein [Streptacidiphilus jeojiense]
MFRLGLRLSLQGGREALVRLAAIVAAVALGVAVVLSILADYNGYQTLLDRPCWECTHGTPLNAGQSAGTALPGTGALWNLSDDYFRGRTIERLDVAALGSAEPVVPGLQQLPAAGQFVVSPALAALLRTVPADQLGDRFPGTQAGLAGDAALSGPDELVVVVGHTPAQLAADSGTEYVTRVSTAHSDISTSNVYKYGFGLGSIAVMFPLLILISTATRLAAARREERYAAMRLVGATPRQINVIASVDSALGALLGTLLGIAVFQLLRTPVDDLAVTGSRFFPAVVDPSAADYAAVVLVVPLASALAALWSLRRVRISPLGTSRRATPPPPGAWRLAPLLLGLVIYVGPLAVLGFQNKSTSGPSSSALALAELGVLLIMVGLILSGSWLTMQVARVVARFVKGPASLLAARRLADNPKAAFRAVSGLVLAVLVGTAIGGLVPSVVAGQNAGSAGSLTHVLQAGFATGAQDHTKDRTTSTAGLPPQTAAALLGRLRSFPGVSVVPIYSDAGGAGGRGAQIAACADLAAVSAIGRCAPGAQDVKAQFSALFDDNLLSLERQLPLVTAASTTGSIDLSALDLQTVLVRVDNAGTLEQIRTLLSTYLSANGVTQPPQTFGEVGDARAGELRAAERVIEVLVGLTVLVAGCSLAVSVGGSLVERRRPFTLLRLSGTPTPTLYRVVVLESMLPLLTATVVAALIGFGTSLPLVLALVPQRAHLAPPDGTYFALMGVGLLASVAAILTALPLLGRMTAPSNAQFE